MAQRAFVEHLTPAPRSRAMRPVDLVHLAKQCLGDEGLEFEILRLFDTTLATYLDRLKLATTFDELALNLHSIKGAASGVGAWSIAELARAMEAELRDARPITPERIADMEMAVEEVRIFVARMLANETA